MINEQDECKSDRDRFDGSKLNKTTDADLEAVDSIATDLSESGDENIEPNDDSSLGMYQTNCLVAHFFCSLSLSFCCIHIIFISNFVFNSIPKTIELILF